MHRTGLSNFIGFFLGVISTLFVTTPFGHVSMLDFSTYFLAPIFFIMDYQRYGKVVRRVLLLSILWLVGGVLTDWWRETPFMIGLKANAIVFNSFTLMVVAFRVLQKSPKSIIYFLAGNAISNVMTLYVFRNGALAAQAVRAGFDANAVVSASEFLVDKMVKPRYVALFIMCVVMPLRLRGIFPWFVCIVLFIGAGVYILLGEGRSASLILFGAGMLTAVRLYCPKLMGLMFKNKLLTVLVLFAGGFCANFAYMQAAKTGVLGESAYKRYVSWSYNESSALDSRIDLIGNWPFLWRHPILGAGAEFIDRWGYLDRNPWISHQDNRGRPISRTTFYGHSCIVGSWTQTGVGGLLFWATALFMLFKFIGDRVFALGDAGPFVLYAMIAVIWGILFSPYGMFRGECMFLIIFVALMYDPKYFALAQQAYLPSKQRQRPRMR